MNPLITPLSYFTRPRCLLAALFCAAMAVSTPASGQTLDDANRAFAEGHYSASTLAYQNVLAQKGYSAPVLFDLGNSYFREGDLGQAILAYKRAQWLSPNDPDIAANLLLAQQRAGLAVPEPSWSGRITGVMSATQWAWIGSGAWAFLCASLLFRALRPRQRSLFLMLGTVSTLALLVAVGAMIFSSRALGEAVVVDKNAAVLISPFPAAQTVFSPAPGETVWVQKTYGDFILVKDAAGHTGWISQSQISRVIPPDAG